MVCNYMGERISNRTKEITLKKSPSFPQEIKNVFSLKQNLYHKSSQLTVKNICVRLGEPTLDVD